MTAEIAASKPDDPKAKKYDVEALLKGNFNKENHQRQN